MIWDELTSVELAECERQCVVIQPLAATEQHGPHLPLSTDRLIAEALCRAIEAQRPDRVLVMPCPPIGCSEHHRAFQGSLSVSHDVFMGYVGSVIDCVVSDGFRNMVLLNAHGGNQGIGSVMVDRYGAKHPDINLVFTSWWQLAHDALSRITTTGVGGVGHACEFETSLMLHLHAEKVRSEKIAKGTNQPTFPWAESDMLNGSKARLHRPIDVMCPNGVYGDPTAASAEKGQRIVQAVVQDLTPLIDDLYTAKK